MADFNVLVITIDALRADYLGCYNQRRKSISPNLTDLAQDSISFENAIAQGTYTRSSIPSFFTSTYPKKRFGGDQGNISSETNLAEVLSGAGYKTAFFHSNPYLAGSLGYSKGFDVFDDSLLPWNLNLSFSANKRIGKLFRIIRKTPYLPAKSLNRKVFSAFDEISSPWFLWVHYMDTHGPFQPKGGWSYLNKLRAERIWHKAVNHPEDLSGQELDFMVNAYRDEISYVDRYVHQLIEKLTGPADDTLLIITADHGEQFGEHGEYSHGSDPYEELIHVPLLLKIPAEVDSKSIDEPVALLDLVPTILDFLEVKTSEYDFDGQSLMPLIEDGQLKTERDYLVTSSDPQHVSLRGRKWKYIALEADRELYDLESDPEEKRNLIHERREIAEKFEVELEKYLADVDEYAAPEETLSDADMETKERLKDLGYL